MAIRDVRLICFRVLVGALVLGGVACSGDPDPTPDAGRKDTGDDGTTPRILSFTASDPTVPPGATVTLSWEVENATGLTITSNPPLTINAGEFKLKGMVTTPAITARTTFTIKITDDAGKTAEASVDVNVDASAVQISKFEATPNPAPVNGVITLSWTTAGATQVRILKGMSQLFMAPTNQVMNGSYMVMLTDPSTTFTLEATNMQNGRATREITVRAEAPARIRAFKVTPQTFSGASAMVSVTWTVTDASSMRLTANGTPVPNFPTNPITLTGTISVTVTDTTQFELTAMSGGGTARETRAVARGIGEMEPNDDSASATNLMAGGGVTAMIGSAMDEDWYKITVPAGANIYAQISDGNSSCAFDSLLTLYDTDGSTELGSDDDDGPRQPMGFGRCSEINPTRDSFARGLDAGTYYLQVTGYSGGMGNYTLIVVVGMGGCGNGFVEPSLNEQCDDANTMSGDGCSMTCRYETLGTVSGPTATMVFRGSISTPGKEDIYAITMTAAGYIRAQTFAPDVPECTSGAGDTRIVLLDSMGQELAENDDSGDGLCSLIDPATETAARVMPGSYVLVVKGFSMTSIVPNYAVEIKLFGQGCGNSIVEMGETCDDGNMTPGDRCNAQCQFEGVSESEPNNTPQVATSVGTGTTALVLGSINPAMDEDVWSINVPAGHHLAAWATIGGFTSCITGEEIELQLIDKDATTVLATDSFSGPDFACGEISPNTTEKAFEMPGGTYFIKVREPNGATVPAYFLHVAITPPMCGNGLREVRSGEQCDDENMTAGDGCAANCRFEIASTIRPPGGRAQLDLTNIDHIRVVQVDVTAAGQSITATAADSGGTCMVDTQIVMLDSMFKVIGRATRRGADGCASVFYPQAGYARDLAVGSYYLVIFVDGATGGMSQLDVTVINPRCGDRVTQTKANEQCDDGNASAGDGCGSNCRFEANVVQEMEPNNAAMMANATGAMAGAGRRIIAGAIEPAADRDFFSFDVPAGTPRTVIARTHSNIGDPMSCDDETDTVIRLTNQAGDLLAENDDSNMSYCSTIDGTMTSTSAANLAPGRYFIEVQRYGDLAPLSRYFMNIELR